MYRKAKQEGLITPPQSVEKDVSSGASKQHCSCNKTKIDPKQVDEDARTFLHIAVLQCGDNDCLINHIIREGCDVNARDNSGYTPLHYAVQKQFIGCVRRLLENRADLNILNKDGWSPLMIACKKGRKDIAELLIQHGAKINMKNSRGEVAIHCAVSAGNETILELLLQHKANVNYTDEKGTTPLILASRSSNPDIINLILKYKPKVNHVDGLGRTALHYCIENIKGGLNNMKELIDTGANLDILDKSGDAPFTLAIKANKPEILKRLVDSGCDLTALDGLNGTAVGMATMLGRTDCIKILLDAGEDADEYGYAGLTPLCVAIYSNRMDIIRLLVEEGGADVNMPSRCGVLPIVKDLIKVTPSTAKMRHLILAFLIRHGVNVNRRIQSVNYFTSLTSGRNCPLSFAISSGYVSLVRMLLLAGTKVSADESHQWKQQAENVFMGAVDSETLIGEITEWASKPRKLKDLCRISIRSMMDQKNILKNISHLPLPDRMKSFLNFDELDSIVPETTVKCEKYDPMKCVMTPCALNFMTANGSQLEHAIPT